MKEFKEGIQICSSLPFFERVWARWFADTCPHMELRPAYQVFWWDCSSTPA